jgi:hypothetical protein
MNNININHFEMLEQMFELQDALNKETNGENWTAGFTKEKAEINWLRPFRFEIIEAIEQSILWKHWKGNKANKHFEILDPFNIKVEVIDAWHFLMSEIIKREKYSPSLMQDAMNEIEMVIGSVKTIPMEEWNGKRLTEKFERIEMETVAMIMEEEEIGADQENIRFNEVIIKFWMLTAELMTLEEIFEVYVKKNTLVEASPIDAIWGIALAEDDKDALDIKKWRGENLLGYILTSLRDNYFLKRDHLLLKSTTRGTGLFKNDYRANYFEIKHLADNEKLKNKINRWNKDTITEESIWIEEGRKIAKELKELVGEDYIVKYLWEDSQEKEVITL